MKIDELSPTINGFAVHSSNTVAFTHVLCHCVFVLSRKAPKRHGVQSFELEARPDMPELGQKWNVLRKLGDKALSIRHAVMSSRASVNELHNSRSSQMQTGNINEDIYNMAIAEGLMWDPDFDMISGLQAFSAEHDLQDRGIQL
jgi:hypothetical protein